MKRIAILTFGMLAAVAGCTPLQYDTFSPDGRVGYDTNRCIRGVSVSQGKSELAVFARVSKDKVAEVVCRRVARGIAQGRITPGDFTKLRYTGQRTEIWKVVKGQ